MGSDCGIHLIRSDCRWWSRFWEGKIEERMCVDDMGQRVFLSFVCGLS